MILRFDLARAVLWQSSKACGDNMRYIQLLDMLARAFSIHTAQTANLLLLCWNEQHLQLHTQGQFQKTLLSIQNPMVRETPFRTHRRLQ